MHRIVSQRDCLSEILSASLPEYNKKCQKRWKIKVVLCVPVHFSFLNLKSFKLDARTKIVKRKLLRSFWKRKWNVQTVKRQTYISTNVSYFLYNSSCVVMALCYYVVVTKVKIYLKSNCTLNASCEWHSFYRFHEWHCRILHNNE